MKKCDIKKIFLQFSLKTPNFLFLIIKWTVHIVNFPPHFLSREHNRTDAIESVANENPLID